MSSQCKSALSQILTALVKNVCLFSFGMIKGFPTILIGEILNKDSKDFPNITKDQISWIGSTSYVSTFVGALLSGVVTQSLGRKKSMQISAIPFIGCWIALHMSSELWHILLALNILGLFGGLLEGPITAFVTEISQPYLRGILTSISPLFVMFGMMMQYLLIKFCQWRTCSLINCAFPALSFILLCFIPESPYWLLMNNKIDRAKKSLAWLRGWTDVSEIESEFEEMMKDNSNVSVTTKNWLKPFYTKGFMVSLGIITTAFAMTCFTGAGSLQTYATNIFKTLNVPMDSYDATVFMGATQLLGTLLGILFVYVFGKRKLFFASIAGVFVCNIIVGTYVYVNDIKYVISSKDEPVHEFKSFGYIPLATLLVLSFVHHFGLQIIPWAMMGEIFPYETRTIGCGLAGAIGCLFLFISKKVYLDAVSIFTMFYTYLLQGLLAFVGFVIMYFFLPETEGKTLTEIRNHFSGVSKLGKKVRRRRRNEHV